MTPETTVSVLLPISRSAASIAVMVRDYAAPQESRGSSVGEGERVRGGIAGSVSSACVPSASVPSASESLSAERRLMRSTRRA
jgi:hypothetical protein